MKKKRKKIYLSIVLVSLICLRVIIHFQTAPESQDVFPGAIRLTKEEVEEKEEEKNPNNQQATTLVEAEKANAKNAAKCLATFTPFLKRSELVKDQTSQTRYVNLHKKIDGVVYRFRFFYKETSENEIPQYLLYQEDMNEEDHLIETSAYKKGFNYQRLEKRPGETLYTEEGINLGNEQDLFLQYENGNIKKIQGKYKDQYYDCNF